MAERQLSCSTSGTASGVQLQLMTTDRCIKGPCSATTFSDLPSHLQSLIMAQAYAPLHTCQASAAILKDPVLLRIWVNTLQNPGRSCERAAEQRQWEVCSALLSMLGERKIQGTHRSTVLYHAAKAGQVHAVRRFLEPSVTSSGAKPSDVRWAFCIAASSGNLDICGLLLQQGYHHDVVQDALNQAARLGQLAVVQLLVAHPQIRPPNIGASTALIIAIMQCHWEVIQYLFEQGTSLRHRPSLMGFGSLQSCLNRAAEAGNIPVVSYLLNESDTVSWDISGALAAAAGEGKLDIMRVILTHKVAPPVEERVAALSAAAAAGQLAAIKLLVELGADLRLCWGSGYSSMGCLAHAITGRHWGVVGYLLQHGAPTGYAALMYAIQSPAAATAVELLLDYGARDILPDCPALQEAVRLGEQEVVDMLLSAGGTGASKTTTAQQFQVACCTAATSGDLHLLQHIINKLDQKCREQAVGLQERAGILSKALQSATRDWSAKGCQQHMREQTKTYKSVFKLLSDSLGANAGGYSGTQLGSDTEGSLPRNLHFLLDVGAVATDDALLIASRHGQADVVASLLSRSQGPVDPSGAAVGYAASHGHTEVLHLLLHHGANVAAACRAAVASGNDRVVAVLASLPSRLMPAWRATELEMVLADTCISRRTRGKVTRV